MTQNTKFDALTIFFVVAAFSLVAIWWVERSNLDRLQQATVAAGEFSRDRLGPSCEAFAVGQEGHELVIRCAKQSDASAAKVARVEASEFTSVLFIDPEGGSVRCVPPEAATCVPVELAAD
jgi:hypothetical protein